MLISSNTVRISGPQRRRSRPLKGALGRIGFSEMSADASGALRRVTSADRPLALTPRADHMQEQSIIVIYLTGKVPGIFVSRNATWDIYLLFCTLFKLLVLSLHNIRLTTNANCASKPRTLWSPPCPKVCASPPLYLLHSLAWSF